MRASSYLHVFFSRKLTKKVNIVYLQTNLAKFNKRTHKKWNYTLITVSSDKNAIYTEYCLSVKLCWTFLFISKSLPIFSLFRYFFRFDSLPSTARETSSPCYLIVAEEKKDGCMPFLNQQSRLKFEVDMQIPIFIPIFVTLPTNPAK